MIPVIPIIIVAVPALLVMRAVRKARRRDKELVARWDKNRKRDRAAEAREAELRG